jgi:hypothetical protein
MSLTHARPALAQRGPRQGAVYGHSLNIYGHTSFVPGVFLPLYNFFRCLHDGSQSTYTTGTSAVCP